MANNRSHTELASEEYYDSTDADTFYEKVWGGEDLHIGLYDKGMSTLEASRRTVSLMESTLLMINPDSKVLDLGAGFGGSARFLAKTHGCHVTCLNISAVQNKRNEEESKKQGLADKIDVQHGSFESIPMEDNSVDIIWSQDSFLHSDKRERIMDEVARVLKPAGEIVFTDPMQADNCPEGVLQPVYDRLNLTSLASFRFYREQLREHGFKEEKVYDLTEHLRTHYATVREILLERYDELSRDISTDYMDKMILGLEHWVQAADKGYLSWGIMHFSRGI